MTTLKMLLGDLAFVTYLYFILISLYALCLFIYWAFKSNGVASAWYYYVMGLIVSGALSTAFQLIARYMYLTDHMYYAQLLRGYPWALRMWIGAAVMTAIAIHATRKLFRSKGGTQ
jgi:hypothetical protein